MTRSLRPIALILLATLLVFAPLCGHEFTWWDDSYTVHHNPWLNPPTLASLKHYWSSVAYGLYIPVTYTMWIGLAAITRVSPDEHGIALNPWVFHSANVIVHVIATLLVFALLRALVKRDWPACLGALLFALHPVQLEAVAWVSGLKDVLAGTLAIAALYRYVLRAQSAPPRPPSGRHLLPDPAATLLFVLAMLAKPSAAMTPLIAATIDWMILRRPPRTVARSVAIWCLLALPILILARHAQIVTGIEHAPLWSRPLIMTDALAFYLGKLLLPLYLAPDYGRRPSVVIAHGWLYYTWIAPVAIAIALSLARHKRRWAAASALVFVIALLPVSGLATFLFQFTSTVADHYLYLAMLGPAMALAFLLNEYHGRAGLAVAATAIVLLAMRTAMLVPVWRDDYRLFGHNLQLNPDSAVALNNLGLYYGMHEQPQRAVDCFERAIALTPTVPQPYDNAAKALMQLGEYSRAVPYLEKSMALCAAAGREENPETRQMFEIARSKAAQRNPATSATRPSGSS